MIIRLDYIVLLCMGLIVFANHYTRDSIGALERQLETSNLNISTQDYAYFNLLYFLPNVLSPLIGGIILQKYNYPCQFIIVSCIISGIGGIMLASGVQYQQTWLLYIGRLLSGIFYECIDTFPVLVVRPLFESNWSLVVGFINALIRLGSVVNFILTPYIYRVSGLEMSFFISAMVGCSSIIFAILAKLSYDTLTRNKGIHLPLDTGHQNKKQPVHNQRFTKVETIDRLTQQDDEEIDDMNDVLLTPSAPSSSAVVVPIVSPTSYISRACENLLSILPLHKLDSLFYVYLISGMCLYGSMVPFWFLGGKLLQVSLPIILCHTK